MAHSISLETPAETGRIHDAVVAGTRSHCDDRSTPSVSRTGAHTRAFFKKAANRRTRRLAPTLTQATSVTTWLSELDAAELAEANELLELSLSDHLYEDLEEMAGLDDLDWLVDEDDFCVPYEEPDLQDIAAELPGCPMLGDELDVEELLAGGFSFTINAGMRGQLRRYTAGVLAEHA